MSENEFKALISKLNDVRKKFNPILFIWILVPLLLALIAFVILLNVGIQSSIIIYLFPVPGFLIIIALLFILWKKFKINRELEAKVKEINLQYINRGIQLSYHLNKQGARSLSVRINRMYNNKGETNFYKSYNQPNNNLYSVSPQHFQNSINQSYYSNQNPETQNLLYN